MSEPVGTQHAVGVDVSEAMTTEARRRTSSLDREEEESRGGGATSRWRWPTAALLSATAAIHMTLVPDHLRDAPYAGALFIVLSAAALTAAILLAGTNHEFVWLGAGALSASALLGYFLSRSIGLPDLSDDLGDWLNPLGLTAVGCEAAAALICCGVISGMASPAAHPARRLRIVALAYGLGRGAEPRRHDPSGRGEKR
jgi:hypothetical protein